MKIILSSLLCLFLIVSSKAFAGEKQEMEHMIVADIGKRLMHFKTPEEAAEKLKSRLNAKDAKYLNELILSKQWVELPSAVKSSENVLTLEFSNKVTISLEIPNYWAAEYKLNGYQLEMNNYHSLEEQIAYLRRVVKSKVPLEKKGDKGAFLFSLMFPFAQASMTCNALVSSGCMEVSVAASLWLARAVSEESPLARCREIYYFNKNQASTEKCLQQYKHNPTLMTIQELSEVLAASPETSVEISCNNKGEGPDIFINGTEVVKLGRGFVATDYSISQAQDRKMKLSKLPSLAIQCCKSRNSDPLNGECEQFVTNHLGPKENRRKEFKNPDLRVRGKALEGVR